jgi:hypothetical protein
MTEVADVFQQYGEAFRNQYSPPLQTLKAMSAIERCRTSALGGHVDACDECGHLKISYNSCRNRHCPKCQNLPKEKWLIDRKEDLLPVPYFHVVFTLPSELNDLALRNKKELYNLLFKASAETLQTLAADPKVLGAQIGFTSILHTWGQNLTEHPHVHCIVTGGGLSPDQTQWISSKSKFLFSVKVMSALFRGKYLAFLQEQQQRSPLKSKEDAQTFKALLSQLYQKDWIVYCKPPFQSPEHVLKYFGRYTHRVAISNHRICHLANGKVTFTWRDYKDGNRKKTMTLTAIEFIRRFLLHILPQRFVKIRHYGLISNANRKTKLAHCRKILGVPPKKKEETHEKETWSEFLFRITGVDPTLCPACGKGHMITQETLQPQRASPIIKREVA